MPDHGNAAHHGVGWKRVVGALRRLKKGGTRSSQTHVEGLESPNVRVQCDLPQISMAHPTSVGNWFMVEGWAVADYGIKEVRMELDGVPIGSARYGISRSDVGRIFTHIRDSEHSGFRKMVNVTGTGKHVLSIIAEDNQQGRRRLQGLLELLPPTLVESEPAGERPVLEKKVSVIIPTRSPPDDLDQTLEHLKMQDGVDTEIVLVNSGSHDLKRIAEEYGAKVVTISPQDYNHARTRNLGAERASGDYLVFMTDDAIPAGSGLLSQMTRFLENREVAAVTTRQLPRTDADIMACYAIWSHYKMLKLNKDRIVSSKNIDKLPPNEKRRICQIDDVCSCYSKETFEKYKYDENQTYAEDLELGLRLVRDGHKLAQLYSCGVMHSHVRTADYYLRRSYVDAKTLTRLLGRDHREPRRTGKATLSSLLDQVLELYDQICLSIDDLIDMTFHQGNLSQILLTIRRQMFDPPNRRVRPVTKNAALSKTLREMTRITHHESKRSTQADALSHECYGLFADFCKWVSGTWENAEDPDGEFVEALFKISATVMGNNIARHFSLARSRQIEEDPLTALDHYLSSGI